MWAVWGEMKKRALEAISEPYLKDGCEYQNSASIGIALFPQHGDSFQQLYKNADISLYRSKKMGKGKATLFER